MDKKTLLRVALTHLSQRPVAYYPVYADLTGSVKAGVLLSQIMYWWSAMAGEKFYKTDAELQTETRLSKSEMQQAKIALKSVEFLIITREGTPGRTHYDIDEDLFFSVLGNVQSSKPGMCTPEKQECTIPKTGKHTITENTTENTQRDEATPPQLSPGDYNQLFFDQGVQWIEKGGGLSGKGDQLLEIARWMVDEKGWNKTVSRRELIKFIDYWTTLDPKGKVPRWKDAKNKYFKLKSRLSTWMSNALS